MTHYYFIKLYHEVLHDPKMGQLPDRLWRRCIELFLLAGENDKEGELPNMRSMCWTLRVEQSQLRAELNQIMDLGILKFGDNDELIVTNFVKRQAKQTGAERVERYRERKRKEPQPVTKSYKDVTPPVTNTVPDIDIDIDIESDNKEEGKPGKNNFQLYDEEIGPLTPLISDAITTAENDYTVEWVTWGINVASKQQKRNWAYIAACLENRRKHGIDYKPNGNGKKVNEPGFMAALREAANGN